MNRHEVPVHMISAMAASNYGLGHTQHAYGFILYALVHWLKPEIIIEIGSRRGFSTMWMAKALTELGRGRVHAIDPFINEFGGGPDQAQDFIGNIEHLGLKDYVLLHIKNSRDAAGETPHTIEMLFCDGNLSEEGLTADLNIYEPRLRIGGCLAIHDLYSEPGVKPVIAKYEPLNQYIPFILQDQLGLWFGIKAHA